MSARLYLPSDELGYEGARPLVYYVHGGPQSQERPNFAWFSMPLIQALTLDGFAVFVPNVRGSTGYGAEYAQRVDRDWGGNDRLDHVFAMQEVLPKDDRIDVDRAGVIGRSYGGFMTLTLASRHPELWRAAVDMFGSYDMLTWTQRVPETWKPFVALTIGDPEKDRDFLVERSPKTYAENIACPLLVIQGQNDPRVVEAGVARPRRGPAQAGQGRRLPRLRGRGPRRAQAAEPRALLRGDHAVLLHAPRVLDSTCGDLPELWQGEPDGFAFCGYCTAPLAEQRSAPPLEERKVVSVLFCDLVGFTAASDQQDPEDVRARIRPYHARPAAGDRALRRRPSRSSSAMR